MGRHGEPGYRKSKVFLTHMEKDIKADRGLRLAKRVHYDLTGLTWEIVTVNTRYSTKPLFIFTITILFFY